MTNSQTSTIKASWDEAVQCVVCEGIGFNKDEKVKEGLNNVLELLKQKEATRLLTDMSQVAPFGKTIESWIELDWLPRMREAGLKTQAFVIPKSAVTRMIMEKTLQNAPTQDRSIAFFDNLEAAKEWLLSH